MPAKSCIESDDARSRPVVRGGGARPAPATRCPRTPRPARAPARGCATRSSSAPSKRPPSQVGRQVTITGCAGRPARRRHPDGPARRAAARPGRRPTRRHVGRASTRCPPSGRSRRGVGSAKKKPLQPAGRRGSSRSCSARCRSARPPPRPCGRHTTKTTPSTRLRWGAARGRGAVPMARDSNRPADSGQRHNGRDQASGIRRQRSGIRGQASGAAPGASAIRD